MSYGAAGIALPSLVLLLLNFIVLVPWLIWGKGNRKIRGILIITSLIAFMIFVLLSINLESYPVIGPFVQIITIAIPIISLTLPLIYKRGLGG